jgi:hypothetical protein
MNRWMGWYLRQLVPETKMKRTGQFDYLYKI